MRWMISAGRRSVQVRASEGRYFGLRGNLTTSR
jgi:hypothetical protein